MPGVQLVVFMVASIIVLWRRLVCDVAPCVQEACQDAKYLTNQKKYTLVMPRICYCQFVTSKLYLVYTIPI